MSGASQPWGPSKQDENTPITFLRSRSLDRNRQRIRILIADDHPVFRYGLRMLLQVEADLQIVGEASDCAEAQKLAAELRPDILLIDLATQRAFGAQALQQIALARPGLRIILLLTAAADRQQIIDALQLGVRGVVMKNASPKTFIKSIRMVMAGEYWIPRGNIADLVHVLHGVPLDPRQKQRTLNLTPRELEIVLAVAGGYTNRDIAERYSISEDTVKHHLTSIFDKWGVANRLELAVLAIGRGLVPAS
jgi:two-component system, NarL family, nitrate/nitrite response regulator NarL